MPIDYLFAALHRGRLAGNVAIPPGFQLCNTLSTFRRGADGGNGIIILQVGQRLIVFLRLCQRSEVKRPTGAIEPLSASVCRFPRSSLDQQKSRGLPRRREASPPAGTLNIHLAAVGQTGSPSRA